jgi:hypothetical protein
LITSAVLKVPVLLRSYLEFLIERERERGGGGASQRLIYTYI